MVLFPETRFEAFLAKIAGQEGPDLEPITRTEAFLDDIAGADHDLEPRTRIEYWLQKIAENAGGGGGDDGQIDQIAMGTGPASLVLRTATSLRNNAFEYDAIQRISAPEVRTAGNASLARTALTKVEAADLPKLASTQRETFAYNDSLVSVVLPALTSTNSGIFRNCSVLKRIETPLLSGDPGDQWARNCPQLEYVDFGSSSYVTGNAFNGDTALNKLVIRKTGTACTLQNLNAFDGTPFASAGAGGTLYVPRDMISAYQAANNWSTLLGYTNNSIAAIEDM